MKAIILSAGQGSRLGRLADERPKCLIEFNGRSLLDRQLDTLDIKGEEWGEVDFPSDVEAARALAQRWDAKAKVAAA